MGILLAFGNAQGEQHAHLEIVQEDSKWAILLDTQILHTRKFDR
jgi:hypothetical protein